MDATYYYNLAYDQSNEKNWEASVNNFDKAQELDPQGKLVPLGYMYINRGNAYRGLGDFEKALVDFNNALTIAPEHAAYIHQSRATAYQNLKRYQEAITDFEISTALFLNQGDSKSHWMVTLQLDVLKVIMLNLLNEAKRNSNI
ncbi:tetratricopeptide repeat protein [Nostoc sp.]|uniref:tetratricopeptide repeat protein n=1 Tax=Nostoc sp. TaxID=1180 RepID=UPI002FFB0610